MNRLDEIEARANAATEGPWDLIGGGEYVTPVGIMVAPDDGGVNGADAEFIAHARTDVPALVAVARYALSQHAPDGHGNCGPCDDATGEDGWPCSTVREIHRLLGEDV